MRDPHVETLHYTINSHKSISYQNAKPMDFSNDLAEFDIADGNLTVKPLEHFADEDAAKRAVESYLMAWEMDVNLNSKIGTIEFKFERSEIVDRNPPKPGESITLEAQSGSYLAVGDNVKLCHHLSEYPKPPSAFISTPDVEIGYRRWISHNKGKESLQTMAYFVLTQLEKKRAIVEK